MGNAVSAAKELRDEQIDELDNMLANLENKLETFELLAKSKRGRALDLDKEIGGGRTVMRVSDIRVASGSDISSELQSAIASFFDAATNEVEGNSKTAKTSAVAGAKSLILGGIRALFGVSQGQGRTKESFVILFMNNAFVRVDYFVYTYSASASKWGAQANESGACYLAELSVLDITKLEPQEIDFLLSQALAIQIHELPILNRIKFALIQSSILGRALARDEPNALTFDDLVSIAEKLAEATKKIDTAFAELGNFKLSNLAKRGIAPKTAAQLAAEKLAAENAAKLAAENEAKLAAENEAKLTAENAAKLAAENEAKLAAENEAKLAAGSAAGDPAGSAAADPPDSDGS